MALSQVWRVFKCFLCCFGVGRLYRWYKSFKEKKNQKQPDGKRVGITYTNFPVKGLRNFGNTCFFNSMLQCVIHTAPLHDGLKEIAAGMNYSVDSSIAGSIPIKGPAKLGQFTMILQQLFNEINTRQDAVLSPGNVLNALSRENTRFAQRTQEDSHEALRCLLSALRNDEISGLKDAIYHYYGVTADPSSHSQLDGEDKLCMKDCLVNASKGAALIDRLIGTMLVSTTICHQCHTPVQIEELCLDLSLPIPSPENDTKPNVSCVEDQSRSKKKTKRHKVKTKHTMTAIPYASDITVNATPSSSIKGDNQFEVIGNSRLEDNNDHLGARATESDSSSDVESMELFNGPYDIRYMHLYDQHDDPSSSEEEESDNEDVPAKDRPHGETLISNVMVNEANIRKHDGPDEVSSAEDTEVDSNKEQCLENTMVFSNYEFNLYLKSKDCPYFQMPLYNEHFALTLEQCLRAFTDLDVLDENNKFLCQNCTNISQSEGVLCRVSKQILIHKLPPVLILQMKRFSIGSHDVTKDNRLVYFPHVLDMAPYCTTQCFEKLGDLNGKILYGLYAVVVHSGSLHGGHYTAYVRQRPVQLEQSAANEMAQPVNAAYDQKRVYDTRGADSGEWYYTSDSHVSRCKFSEVQRCQAYLLFYEMLPLVFV